MSPLFSRAFSGEGAFQNIYTAQSDGIITFSASFPGSIMPLEIAPGREMVVQKDAFLASEMGVELSIHFNKKATVGFLGGQGFIMQKLSGRGTAFVELAGALEEYELAAGEQMVVDTGNVAGFEPTVNIAVESVAGLKNKLLGGEGFFNTVLTGPGKIWLQTMSIECVAGVIRSFIPSGNG